MQFFNLKFSIILERKKKSCTFKNLQESQQLKLKRQTEKKLKISYKSL